MLSPIYYEKCADGILTLYEQLENDVISDIIRRIVKTGKVTAAAEYQLEILKNSGILYDEILSEIAKKTGETEEKIKIIFEKSGTETVESDNKIYRENGLNPIEIRQSEAMKKTLESGWKKTLKNVKNLTLTTADTSQTAYINACNSAYMQVASGAFSYQEAIKNAVKKTAGNGVFVRYSSGHVERIDVAVRRAVLTGVGQTCREIGIMNAEEAGCDLMEISAHSGARPSHAKWQGKIVSLSGKKGYLSKRDIGYGTGDGFGGWNCRHDWFPFFEGYSRKNYTENDLKKLDEKNIEYNEKKYSEYEISQIQRGIEREIRSAKREKIAFETAVNNADDPEIKSEMQEELENAKRKVAEKQRKMREFVGQTGQNRDYFREQNYSKENSRNVLTFSGNSGNIRESKNNIRYTKEKEFGVLYGEQATHIDSKFINSKEFKTKFKNATENTKVNIALYQCSKKMLLHRDGTLYEDMYIINADTGYILGSQINSQYPQGVVYNDSIKNALKLAKEKNIPIITIHNHPEGYPPSVDDFNSAFKNNTVCGFAIGHNGQLYRYENHDRMFSKQEIKSIHDEISYNFTILGMDVDRSYEDVFTNYGIKYVKAKE